MKRVLLIIWVVVLFAYHLPFMLLGVIWHIIEEGFTTGYETMAEHKKHLGEDDD
jgi:hypothetical protein